MDSRSPQPTAPPPSPSSPSTPSSPSSPSSSARRVDWRAVVVFFAMAITLLAVTAAPFWILPEGIAHPLYTWLIALGMFAPSVAATITVLAVQKRRGLRTVLGELGLRFRGNGKRILLWMPLAALLLLAINALTALFLVLRGVPGDLSGRTWAQTLTQQLTDAGAPMSTTAAIAITIVGAVVGLVVTVLPSLGEEIGWRGWLWQQLKPLGFSAAIGVGGTIWALWHLPVLLIGHNYPGMPRPQAIGMFIVFCTAANYLLGAITERAGGNVLPAAVAHATLNSTMGLLLAVVSTTATAAEVNWYLDATTGVTGIVLITVAGLLVMPRRAKQTFGPRESTTKSELQASPA